MCCSSCTAMTLANCINFTHTGNIMKKYMTGAVRLSAMVAGMMMAWQAAAAQPKELNLGILGGQNAT